MVRPGRDRLSGWVEVDETYVGGMERGKGRRELGVKKVLVAIAAEIKGRGMGRIRLGRIRDASEQSLGAFVKSAVEPGSVLVTDGLWSYGRLRPWAMTMNRSFWGPNGRRLSFCHGCIGWQRC